MMQHNSKLRARSHGHGRSDTHSQPSKRRTGKSILSVPTPRLKTTCIEGSIDVERSNVMDASRSSKQALPRPKRFISLSPMKSMVEPSENSQKSNFGSNEEAVSKDKNPILQSSKQISLSDRCAFVRVCRFQKRDGMKLNVDSTLANYAGSLPNAHLPLQRSLGICYYEGVKVTMIDDAKKIFVIDLVPPQICDLVLLLTEDHIQNIGEGRKWRKLYSYTSMDLPCFEVQYLPNITNRIMQQVVKIIGKVFNSPIRAAFLKPRSWKEPHLLRYQKLEDTTEPLHTGVEMHYDGSHFTWQLMLSDANEYDGGGTYFSCLRKTLILKKGQVLVHPGDLHHKGLDITSGVRTLLVCFMDGFDSEIEDTSDWSLVKPEWEHSVVIA